MLSMRRKSTTYATILSMDATRISNATIDILVITIISCMTLTAVAMINAPTNDITVDTILVTALIHCVR